MNAIGFDHVQLAMPAGLEAEAVAFYEGVLRIPQVAKPPQLAGRGGCWFEAGAVKIHLGVDPDFRPANKSHPALIVTDLQALTVSVAAAGLPVIEAEPLDGFVRAHISDPFGNRIELVQSIRTG